MATREKWLDRPDTVPAGVDLRDTGLEKLKRGTLGVAGHDVLMQDLTL